MRYEEPRHVWTGLPITHRACLLCVCVFITAVPAVINMSSIVSCSSPPHTVRVGVGGETMEDMCCEREEGERERERARKVRLHY